jgi:hypothetical protein
MTRQVTLEFSEHQTSLNEDEYLIPEEDEAFR